VRDSSLSAAHAKSRTSVARAFFPPVSPVASEALLIARDVGCAAHEPVAELRPRFAPLLPALELSDPFRAAAG